MAFQAPDLNEDRTVYPVEERVGEDILQRWITELLRPLLERWLSDHGRAWFVGSDQFIYYEQFNPTKRAAPDVYVLPGVKPDTHVRSWKVWETGIAPSFVLEVVSSDWEKDYSEAPLIYDRMGVTELVIFDPNYTSRREGRRWQRYYRAAGGKLEFAEQSDGEEMRCAELSVPGVHCSLVCVGLGHRQRIRLLQEDGTVFPTAEEAERAAREAERAAREAERALKEAALSRIAELESKLKGR